MNCCNKCGAELKEDMKFCFKCGEKVIRAVIDSNKCAKCNSKLKKGAKFCFKCGYKVDIKESYNKQETISSAKSDKANSDKVSKKEGLPEDASIWKKISYSISNFLEEDEDEKPKEEEFGAKDEELELDLSFITSNKYLLVAIALLAVLVIAGIFYMFSGTKNIDADTPVFKAMPILKYNPTTRNAKLIIEDKNFVRNNEIYGDYADLMHSINKGGTVPSRAEAENVFKEVPNMVDVLIGEEQPNYEDQPYEAEIHTLIPLKKEGNIWISDTFKINPIEGAVWLILWNDVEEFPYGSMNGISLAYSEDI